MILFFSWFGRLWSVSFCKFMCKEFEGMFCISGCVMLIGMYWINEIYLFCYLVMFVIGGSIVDVRED